MIISLSWCCLTTAVKEDPDPIRKSDSHPIGIEDSDPVGNTGARHPCASFASRFRYRGSPATRSF